MPILKEEDLNKSIRSESFYPVYLLYGSETYQIRKALQLLLKKAAPKTFAEFNLQKFDGETTSFNDLETAYEALPMMAERKCIVVKNWNFDKLAKNDLEKLVNLLENPNPSSIFIMYFTNQNADLKKNAKSKKICDIIGKIGAMTEFAQKDKASLRKILSDRCAKAGSKLPSAVCDKLIDWCGQDLSILMNETDKLISYAGNREITKQDVQGLCTQSIQGTAFDLSNAILQNNYQKAFSILDRLFSLRTEPLMILGALNMSFIDLYRLKAAQSMNLTADQVIHDFRYKSRYRMTKLYQSVSLFSMEQIRNCIESLVKADMLLKSSRLDNRIILEQMLGEMMAHSVLTT